MARYYGKIGFISTVEQKPGIYEPKEIQKLYFGDIIKLSSKWQQGTGVNDDMGINMEVSIMADDFAYEHFSEIKYVEYMGALWKVTQAVPERPRISLYLGGLWNGQ